MADSESPPRVSIPHDAALPPGTWTLLDGYPTHCCPKCGVIAVILNHSISAGGELDKPLGCFHPCDYRVSATLVFWIYGRREAGALRIR